MTSHPRTWHIHNLNLVAEECIISLGALTVQDGVIAAIHEHVGTPEVAAFADAADVVIDGEGGYLLPGFIDMHVHGGHGADFMDATPQAYDTITRYHAGHGTTGMLATTMTAPQADIEAVLDCAARYREAEMPYAQLLGVHLEGPFISPRWPGAQNPAHISPPRPQWLAQWQRQWPDLIRQVTLAPEAEGALPFVAALHEAGIIAAAGHTDADYDTIVEAVRHGLSQAVHTFNAMTPLHHRQPGTAGAVLTTDAICAELIADGLHVHPAVIALLARVKPPEQLVLITDAMSAAGLGDGQYALGGLDVTVRSGEARLTQGGNLAGSTLTMIGAIRYMHRVVGVSLPDASRMASGNPARRLGIDGHTGSIAVGKRADLVWASPELEVRRTWVGGRSVTEG
ncbi:N-acetylglucosamine-6-phosphate deacetylase [Paenibacillus sp. IB182496]|uniref:N-acetylglucosamine-6-phosphate deacetylase n=1 Tax=Paenibacillus sabuli TaxID=2772509 RepID=A0A927GR80_9BACL|nr:N-acetylglucosamine-6-phosphate deacetylase [Paenibacillus sabuli]MBD2844665.1 N-acetylglucosamine-6-phosphate deacetylase [Paenibacillus sabuli]